MPALRMSVTLTASELEEFRRLRSETGIRYYSTLIRNAIRLMLFVERVDREGSEVQIKHADGSVQRLKVIV